MPKLLPRPTILRMDERAAFPLGSKAFSHEVSRQLEERLAYYDERRRASS